MKKLTLLKENIKILVFAVVAVGVMALAGCNDDGPEGPTEEIIALIKDTEGLDSLAKYLELYPSVAAAVTSDGDYTFFAPTNTAFISLLSIPGFPPNIESVNPDIIANVLAYHVSATRYNAVDLTAGTEIVTLAQPVGDEIITVNQDGTLSTGSSTPNIEIITTDIEATNGVIHTTGSVLIPLALSGLADILPKTYGPLRLSANFSMLWDGIVKADVYASENQKTPIAATLIGETFHTIFAPTNATLSQVDGIENYTGAAWYSIILNHVVMDDVTAAELTSTAAQDPGISDYSSALQVPLYFLYNDAAKQNGIGIFIDSNGDQEFEAEVAVPDIAAADLLSKTNGRIHIIAGVMSPPAQ